MPTNAAAASFALSHPAMPSLSWPVLFDFNTDIDSDIAPEPRARWRVQPAPGAGVLGVGRQHASCGNEGAANEAQPGSSQAQESLQAPAGGNMFSLMLQSMLEGVYCTDREGRCLFINQAGADLLGYAPGELVGRALHALVHHRPVDQAVRREALASASGTALPCAIDAVAQGGSAVRLQGEVFWRKDGTRLPVSCSVSPMTRESRPAGAVVVFASRAGQAQRGQARQRHLDEQLDEQLDELAALDARSSTLLAEAAHELRQLLSPLNTGLALLARGAGKAQSACVVEIMARQAAQIEHLGEQLLEASRMGSSELALQREPVALTKVIFAAIETSLPGIEAAGHTLDVQVVDDSLVLDADPVRLEQAISYLLGNAAKYTPSGERIELSARREGEEAVIAVSGSGIGMDMGAGALEAASGVPGQAPQGGMNPDAASTGMGGGLALVRQIAEGHGGMLSAQSNGPGLGSTFILRLPLAHN